MPVVFLDADHWAAVCVDTRAQVIYYLDTSGLCRQSLTKVIDQLAKKLPNASYRTRYYQPFSQQLDNYNCGIFTVMFYESLISARVFPVIDRRLLQAIRCRCMCISH